VPSRALADTSIFVAGEAGRPLDVDALPDELAVSVVTVGELRAGVLVAASGEDRARRLRTLTRVLALDPVPVGTAVAEAWADLRLLLRDHGLRMPVNDSWIAATALALGVAVVTQDGDYPAVGGLEVVRA
jgi:predicted nucleic acid-binding protein